MKYTNPSIALLLAAALSGCGGGGSSSSSEGPTPDPDGGTPVAAALSGRFLDAPVAGLKYTIAHATGHEAFACEAAGCVTDANGVFHYHEGDQVTFALGSVTLGTVNGAGIVTPETVAKAVVAANPAADESRVRDNLLVFLQSLDADGNPDNGITITPAIADAVGTASPVDFTVAEADFTNQITQVVAEVSVATGNTDLIVVSHDDARNHFHGQLAQNLAGSYVWSDADGVISDNPPRTLTLFRAGGYILGNRNNDPVCDEEGATEPLGNSVDVGNYQYDAGTLSFVRAGGFDGVGSCGVGNKTFTVVSFDGNLLTLDEDGEGVFYYARIQQSLDSIGGSWMVPIDVLQPVPELLVMSFFPSQDNPQAGRYLLADGRRASLDRGNAKPGIEHGCYSIDAAGKPSFNARNTATCPGAVDTNGDDGLHGNDYASIKVDAYGRLELNEPDDEGDYIMHFLALNGPGISIADLAGVWTYEAAPNVDPESQPEMNVLAVNRQTGNYVLGTLGPREGDPDRCLTSWYAGQGNLYGEYEAYGNGVEVGRLLERTGWEGKGTGVVRTAIDPAQGGLDTNGDCGMHNGESAGSGNDFFLFHPSPRDPDVMLVWESGEDQSFSFRRVKSEANSVVGAWQHYDVLGEARAPELSVFFPGGQFFTMMYDASSDTRDQGARRELWVIRDEAPQVGFTADGFAYCVDTLDDDVDNPLGFCAEAESGTHWGLTVNAEFTEGSHEDGTIRKLTP